MPHLHTTQRRSSAVHEHDGPPRAYARLEPLLAEYAATTMDNHRRRQLQTELTIGFLPLVHHIARRYAGRGEPTADLEQAGAIGLLHALRRFDPTRGNDFLSFAIPTITGEMRRHFRDRAWAMRVPRRYKDMQAPIREAVAALSGTLGRAPKPSEVAAELDEPVREVIEALGASQAYCLDSLDSPAHGSDQGLRDTLGMVDSALDTVEYRESLRHVLHGLPERERTIVILRFFGDLTQTQIAERVGISQMHVSRLLSQTLKTLRRHLEAD